MKKNLQHFTMTTLTALALSTFAFGQASAPGTGTGIGYRHNWLRQDEHGDRNDRHRDDWVEHDRHRYDGQRSVRRSGGV